MVLDVSGLSPVSRVSWIKQTTHPANPVKSSESGFKNGGLPCFWYRRCLEPGFTGLGRIYRILVWGCPVLLDVRAVLNQDFRVEMQCLASPDSVIYRYFAHKSVIKIEPVFFEKALS